MKKENEPLFKLVNSLEKYQQHEIRNKRKQNRSVYIHKLFKITYKDHSNK
jgi:hypothetical protein